MGLFSRTIRSNSTQRNPALRPLALRMSEKLVYDKLKPFLNQNGYEQSTVSPDYHEAYALRDGHEFTFMVFPEGNRAILSVMVYTETKPFSKKKLLRNSLDELRAYFADQLM